MRHSDPKLTAQVYTDTKQFNMLEAINKIPDLSNPKKGGTKRGTHNGLG